MRTYEAMFLLDASNDDFETVSAPVRELMERIQAEVLAMKPWDERRLAYEIKGRKRGLYVLTYFKAEPGEITNLNHEVQISEKVLRAIVLSGDHISEETVQAQTPATLSAARRAAADAEKEASREAKESAPEPAAAEPADAGGEDAAPEPKATDGDQEAPAEESDQPTPAADPDKGEDTPAQDDEQPKQE